MKSRFLLLCILSILTTLLAYPVDYNETAIAITKQALDDLQDLILEDIFSESSHEFNNKVIQLNNKTRENIKSSIATYSQHLLRLQKSATNLNVNTTDCSGDPKLIENNFSKQYFQDCLSPSLTLKLNLIYLGFNKQTKLYNKYEELMNNFNASISDEDPTPQICAGVVDGTLQEVKRLTPTIKAYGLKIQRELKTQIQILTNCAYEHSSVWKKRLQVELNIAKTCILDKINTA